MNPTRNSRAMWHREITKLKAGGMTGAAAARHLGLSHSFVYSVLADPSGDGERQRKQKYATPCERCGKLTTADGSRHRYCAACNGREIGIARRGTGRVSAAALAAFSEPLRVSELAARLGVTYARAYNLRSRLLAYGLILLVERGLYQRCDAVQRRS